jgi:hypothetical protein
MAIKAHLHAPMLRDIAQALQERAGAGAHTHLGKVPAHIGISGNEHADKLANQAAAHDTMHDIIIPTDNSPFPGRYWPGRHKNDPNSCSYFANMHKHLTQALPKHCPAAPRGIYCRSWEAVQPQIDPTYAPYIHSARIPFQHRRTAMRYRHGSLWNVKLANRMHIPYTATTHAPPTQPDACPLCGKSDSGGHILGDCQHPHMKGLVIQRHNETTQHIAQALRFSPIHDTHAYLWVDAGKDVPSHLQAESRLLPSWLLPSLSDSERRQYRPDILYIPNWDHNRWEQKDITPTTKAATSIYLLEIGYGPDTRYHEKRAEKLQQHSMLVQHLRAEGWTVKEPCILTFGVGGTIYKDFRETLASTFKLPASTIDNLAHKLQRHTLEKAHQLVSTRRFLERVSIDQPRHSGNNGTPDTTHVDRNAQLAAHPHSTQRIPGHRNTTSASQARATGHKTSTDVAQERTKNYGHKGLNRGHAPTQSDPLRPRAAGVRKRTDRKRLTGGEK